MATAEPSRAIAATTRSRATTAPGQDDITNGRSQAGTSRVAPRAVTKWAGAGMRAWRTYAASARHARRRWARRARCARCRWRQFRASVERRRSRSPARSVISPDPTAGRVRPARSERQPGVRCRRRRAPSLQCGVLAGDGAGGSDGSFVAAAGAGDDLVGEVPSPAFGSTSLIVGTRA